jgi:hypothetical protein
MVWLRSRPRAVTPSVRSPTLLGCAALHLTHPLSTQEGPSVAFRLNDEPSAFIPTAATGASSSVIGDTSMRLRPREPFRDVLGLPPMLVTAQHEGGGWPEQTSVHAR